jgi:hypothetical protein
VNIDESKDRNATSNLMKIDQKNQYKSNDIINQVQKIKIKTDPSKTNLSSIDNIAKMPDSKSVSMSFSSKFPDEEYHERFGRTENSAKILQKMDVG